MTIDTPISTEGVKLDETKGQYLEAMQTYQFGESFAINFWVNYVEPSSDTMSVVFSAGY